MYLSFCSDTNERSSIIRVFQGRWFAGSCFLIAAARAADRLADHNNDRHSGNSVEVRSGRNKGATDTSCAQHSRIRYCGDRARNPRLADNSNDARNGEVDWPDSLNTDYWGIGERRSYIHIDYGTG